MALMQGFCTPQSADPGQTIDFRTSTTASTYQVTILRTRNQRVELVGPPDIQAGRELVEGSVPSLHAHLKGIPVMHNPFGAVGHVQPSHPPNESCLDWKVAFSLDITDDWRSGMYAAKCVDADGSTFYIMFVVNPNPNRRNPILVLANVNTWNSYNDM